MNTLSTSNPSSSTAASFDSYADQYYLALNQGLSISGEGKEYWLMSGNWWGSPFRPGVARRKPLSIKGQMPQDPGQFTSRTP